MQESASERFRHLLWHYTTADAFLKILNSGVVFATAFNHLNDADEIGYARKVLEGVVTKAIGEKAPSDQREEWLRRATWWVQHAGRPQHRSGDIDLEGTIGVFSLSADGDSLGQWRAYGGQAPIAIGFQGSALEEIEDAKLEKCVYKDAEAALVFAHLTAQLLYEIESSQLMATSFRQPFFAVAARVKHPKFSEEAEWRLVTRTLWPREFRLRTTDSRIVPYYPLRFTTTSEGAYDWRAVWPTAIARIRVGPGRHDSLTFDALSSVLAATGPAVDRSEIPYRSLI